MPLDICHRSALLVDKIYRPIQNNKVKFISYVAIALLSALLLSFTLGEHYDGLGQKSRGAPRKRQPREAKVQSESLKDPFPNRPRIQTRNGHLVIEASQDKSIEFKTSGSRGTVSINGHKLDQLLDVTKALERSTQLTGVSNVAGTVVAGASVASPSVADQYEMVLRSLLGSGQRFLTIEKSISDLKNQVTELGKQVAKVSRRLTKRLQQVNKVSKQQELILTKLKRNDCFNSDTGQPVCKNGATCLDTYNGFKCLCPANYEGATCEQDVDECAKFRGTDLGCQNGARCVNLPGSYKCECPSQYHGIHCTELHDDCALSSSRSLCGSGKCINLARNVANQARYECVCEQGWTTDGTNPACVIDINECLVGQSLGNLNASVDSSSAPWTNSLMAAYPCSQNPFVECINLPGSFQCGPCPPGYLGNGRVCRDIDECSSNNGGCSTMPLVECINTQGSRRCGLCPPGYTGDGVTCARISACSLEPNGGCHTMAKCVELTGVSLNSRICICQYPYTGEGVGVAGCRLISTPGNLIPPSFSNRNDSMPSDINATPRNADCYPNPCLNNAQCQQTDSSFECICSTGWSGRLCDEQSSVCGGNLYASLGILTFPLGGSFNQLVKMNTNQDENKSNSATGDLSTSERHYNCNWSISVATNMSVQLVFSQLINKVNPTKKVQMFLANSTTNQQAPICAESLDVRERLDSTTTDLSSPQAGAGGDTNRRLLARFCTEARGLKQQLSSVAGKREIVILSESNTVDLEYSFAATRTQFGEPSLAFNLNWSKVKPPCGGELAIADSGAVSSPKFPDFYLAGTYCRYLIRVPAGKRIRIQFGELNLLTGRPFHSGVAGSSCSDSLIILDGSIGTDRPVIFKHCANNATLMSKVQIPTPIVSSSSTIELVLDSRPDSTTPLMRPKQQRGFYLTYASEPATPGCGGLYTAKTAIIKSADYEPDRVNPSGQIGDPKLALQLSRYFESKDNQVLPNSFQSSFLHTTRLRGNSSRGAKSTGSNWWRVRCEYEIRPADQARNHKISLDWLDIPGGSTAPDSSALGQWSRQLRCTKARLIVYDGNPLDGTNRTEIASFCAGDKYNASLPMLIPIVSTGHVLFLVYEASQHDSDDDNNSGQAAQIGSGYANWSATGWLSESSKGFKLRYSTVCTAVYYQLNGRIEVEVDSEVSECIYHIMLPPNNTISLLIAPPTSKGVTDLMVLPDGSCAAQAIFMDGAIQGGKLALIGAERQLKMYNFRSDSSEQLTTGGKSGNNNASITTRAGDIGSGSATDVPGLVGPDSDSNSYWQYSSSQVHDIKEFEVCKLPVLSFDSVWNHLSLLFRLNPRLLLSAQQVVAGEQQTTKNAKMQLTVRYQAEPSCGGIISDPRGDFIKLDSSRRISALNSFPITPGRYEQLHKQQFMNPCAWILRGQPNQIIQLKFVAPIAEIQRRFNDWLSWSKKQQQQRTNRTVATTEQLSSQQEFNCSQVFQEMIELYEPASNRTRHLCPTDLIAHSLWTTQSSIVYIRLLNNTNLEQTIANQTGSSTTNSTTTTTKLMLNSTSVWPGRKPLNGTTIGVRYDFLSIRGNQCGGKLIQDSGLIISPRFPFNYPANANCVWIIQAHPNQQIRLNITKFELEKQSGCLFDYLELRNGPSSESPLIGRFCNHDLQSKVIMTHSNLLWLNFRSDAHLSRSGFEIYYDGAQTGCGGKLSTPSGQIDSPNYPQAYAHSSDCEWIIELSQSNKIELTIVDLDLSSESNGCHTNGSANDYLEIFDSGPEFLTKSLGKICHKNQLKQEQTTIRSTSNKLYIVYKSQALDNSRGFRLTYRTICTKIELVGYRGVIESPGFPAGYVPHLNCGWTIRAPLGSNLTLAITDLEIEENYSVLSESTQPAAAAADSGDKKSNSTTPVARRRCLDDAVKIWAIQLAANTTNTSQSVVLESAAAATTNSFLSDSPTSYEWNQYRKNNRPKNGKLVRSLCGTLSNLNETERTIEVDTNVVYISFDTDRTVEMSGFRIEWQSQGCGGQQTGKSMQPISYQERANLLGRPTECLWSYDLSRTAKTIEFHVNSDLRSPDSPQSASTNLQQDPCEDGSLIIYDGLTDKAPILSTNCDSQRNRETIHTSSGQALVRFYTSGRHNYGRGFSLNGWPNTRDSCFSSVLDTRTPFNQIAGVIKSPNYPDLYDADHYHCYGMLTAEVGRLRVHIDELDIPIDSESQASSLLESDVCQSSGNYLIIKNLEGPTGEVVLCGKLDKEKESSSLSSLTSVSNKSEIILEQEAAWYEFHSKGALRGRWKLSYDRLCGSVAQVDYQREFTSPNYPAKPSWSKSGSQRDDATKSENVCIWRLKTNYPYSSKQSSEKKLHLNIVNFIESNNNNSDSVDCVRIYEGIDLSLRQSYFNLTDIDAKYQPKIKICKQSDIKHTSLNYVSQGGELVAMVSGNTVVKFRVKPFENYCGGEFLLDRAEFASLGYPQPYTSDLDCHYFIIGSPGSRIKLKFLTFDLPEGEPIGDDAPTTNTSTSCDNVDHIEIRQLSLKAKLKSRLDSILGSTWNSDRLFFMSTNEDAQIVLPPTNSAASVKNKTSSPTTTTTPTPTPILRPATPSPPERVSELAKLYNLIYGYVYQHNQRTGSQSRTTLPLADFYENSNLLGRYCGKKAPTFTADQFQGDLLIRFRSHSPPKVGVATPEMSVGLTVAPRGFLAEYKIEYGGFIQFDNGATGSTTADKTISSVIGLDDGSGFIGSPMYPVGFRYNNSIRWTFETKLDSIIQFDLISLDLGQTHRDCKDTLSIFDGLNVETSVKLSQVCGHLSYKSRQFKKSSGDSYVSPYSLLSGPATNFIPVYSAHDPRIKSNLIRSVRTTTNVASVIYDNYHDDGSFLLRYKAVSKVSLLAESTIANGNSTTNGNQTQSVTGDDAIDANEAIQEQEDQDQERGDGSPGSPTTSFGGNSARNASKTCSHSHRLWFGTLNVSQVVLSSPNWPQQPPNDIECHWLIYTQENTNIKLSVDPSDFASTYSSDDENMLYYRGPDFCSDPIKSYSSSSSTASSDVKRNYIAVHDGATRLSPLMARYCLPVPPIQLQSTGRHLLIRYVHEDPSDSLLSSTPTGVTKDQGGGVQQVATTGVTAQQVTPDQRNSRSLFKARASIGECGGQYHIMSTTKIRDRQNRNKVYENNLDCKYYVFAATQNQVLVLHNDMSELELSSEPTNADCSVGDYIEIRDLPIQTDFMDFSRSLTGRSLGRFCAGKKLEYLESPGSAISIEFHTDGQNVAKGWQLFLVSTVARAGCTREQTTLTADEPFGRFTSPNWPHGFYGRRHCKYSLIAPVNQSILVTFVRLNRPLAAPGDDGQAKTGNKCGDKFYYLPDDEAISLRYEPSSLQDPKSYLSGNLLQQLVKDVPCKTQVSTYHPSVLSIYQSSTSTLLMNDEQIDSDIIDMPGFKKITADEYYRLRTAAPWGAFTIKTNSHYLLLDYETKNLLPREGFVAIYRQVDDRKYKCGGEVSAQNPLIESAMFGEETLESDDYIQCEWTLKRVDIRYDSEKYITFHRLEVPDRSATIEPQTFEFAFIVFQTLEIPPLLPGASMADDEWSNWKVTKSNEVCGLNRLILSPSYHYSTFLACGNLTGVYRWAPLSSGARKVSIRTKNLRVPGKGNGSTSQQGSTAASSQPPAPIYRGVRAYYYENPCAKDTIIGEAMHFKTIDYPNTSYTPSICEWTIQLTGGEYELWFDSVQFRPPENYVNGTNAECNTDNPDLDYLEIRHSSDRYSPKRTTSVSRYCFFNQMANKRKHLSLNMDSSLTIVFVAGLKMLTNGIEGFQPTSTGNRLAASGGEQQKSNNEKVNFGFDMTLLRIKNESESDFCRQLPGKPNIYWFIRNKEFMNYYDSSSALALGSFLYPKNAHCVVNLDAEEGSRFNISFKGIFDFEVSGMDCQNDFIQVDELISVSPVDSTNYSPPSTTKKPTLRGAKNQPTGRDQPNIRRIGKWCGKTRPKGYFMSNSSRILITFHSNERVEGKGFQLVYNVVTPSNNSST